MYYFSQVQLQRGLSPQDLGRAIPKTGYAEHQAIWRFFPHIDERPFLYRREQIRQWPMFYVLSSVEPQADSQLWQVDTKPFNPQLAAGDRLAFMLRVNPVHSRRDERSKVVRDDVVMRLKKSEIAAGREPDQSELMQKAGEQWLRERAKKLGCVFDQIIATSYKKHWLYKSRQSEPIQFSTIDLQGVLQVTDAEEFLNMCFFGKPDKPPGIGPSKSFGCGLLMVKRA